MTLPAEPQPEPTLGEVAWEWTKSILVALVVWLFLRTFLVEAFRIPSGSMENTLLVGDFLFVNKAVFGAEIPFTGRYLPAVREPVRGDVLVFDSVEEEGLKVVKRLMGMAGDTLQMKAGAVYRNGQLLDEPYAVHQNLAKSEDRANRLKMRRWQIRHLVGDTTNYAPDLQHWGPIVVPPDSLFMMGDNRENSYDGRYWGFLPRSSVRGTPLIVYYSYDPNITWKILRPITAIRWSRLFSHPH